MVPASPGDPRGEQGAGAGAVGRQQEGRQDRRGGRGLGQRARADGAAREVSEEEREVGEEEREVGEEEREVGEGMVGAGASGGGG